MMDSPLARRYSLEAVFTEEELGTGAYGSVIKIYVDGKLRAGKIIHSILIDENPDNINVKKFERECEIMFLVDHPNITKFFGLSYKPELKLPIIVMEMLEGNLYNLLKGFVNPPIPIDVKKMFLENVANGLDYLHNFNKDECIQHRDLTAMNVLLSSELVAKITDFGVSRLISKKQIPLTQSNNPGHSSYMPPEADVEGKARYGPKLDIFSFGHLALVTLTQITDEKLRAHNYLDEDGKRVPLSEVQRRSVYLEEFEALNECDGFSDLKGLVIACLSNEPEDRPSSGEVLHQLQALKKADQEDKVGAEVIKRGLRVLEEARRNNPPFVLQLATFLKKISYITAMILFCFVIIQMGKTGALLALVLQYPFTLCCISGVIFYSFAFLFDFVFFSRTRLFDVDHLKFHFPLFLAIWFAFCSIIFVSLIPPLNLTSVRIIFRHSPNCNAFQKPPIYICYTLDDSNNQIFYTTVRQGCAGNVDNATSFYIISLWTEAKNHYKLNKKVTFYPLPNNESTKYTLPKEYCIQAAATPSSNDTHLQIAFYSWDGEKNNLEDTGYIDFNDLEDYNTGWYKVSNCKLEISRLFFKNYCTTGYVSSFYVNVPEHMKSLLHVNE